MDAVYIETSIVSHATAWPSPDPATAVLQDQAKRWMDEQRPLYETVTSQLVIDALHVAAAALAGVQYLLTQNCKHIANAHQLPRVYRLLDELGLSGMLICTPFEFLGGADYDT